MQRKPKVLSIAGFDPSGGAGIVSDVKTFEAHNTYGLSVCSAITAQNEADFIDVKWLSIEDIVKQINPLTSYYEFEVVKIGLIQDINVLEGLVNHLSSEIENCKIIWDPILSSSSGYLFHQNISYKQLENICNQLYLITPNYNEANQLSPEDNAESTSTMLSHCCSVLLKGGHTKSPTTKDFLYVNGEVSSVFEGSRRIYDKHGTGCVLSASIAANLAKGNSLIESCRLAKTYIHKFLESNKSKIGYHNYELTS